MRLMCTVAVFAALASTGAADAVLFGFEEQGELSGFDVNTPARVDAEWASQGRCSLRIEFAQHVPGETPDFPNAACWREGIPERDWRGYRYYSFDVYAPEDDTYLGVIVQRSDERRDRMDRRYSLPKGAYRMWFNIENAVAEAGNLETVAAITEIEFFQSKPERSSVVFIDNIRLTNGFDSQAPSSEAIWIETLDELAAHPPVHEAAGPGLDAAEPLAQSPADARRQRLDALRAVARGIDARAATESLALAIDTQFSGQSYGVLVAPIEEHVFFTGQGVADSWERTLELDVLRGEARSKQLVIFPAPGRPLAGIRLSATDLRSEGGGVLGAEHVALEMVGYVNLADSAMHRFRGFTDFGWYPDPVLALDQPFAIAPPRELQPVLVTIRVPRDTPPGTYTGTIRVAPEQEAPYTVDVTLRVHGATMPVAARLPHLIHAGLEGFSPEFRLNPNNSELGDIYRWGSPVEPERIAKAVEDGMNRFNLYRISQFNLAARCGEHGEAEGMQGFLNHVCGMYPEPRMAALAERGLCDKAVFYGFDEVSVDDATWRGRIERAFGALKERYGPYGVKTATTARPWTSPGAWDLGHVE
ncbi:MAG: hypothetical protein JXR94_11535 [Candidatus Hydrogenedentes bacterium]|nr:hypothetical protein [Candidatus Hydrogenedentota bacterium]